MLFLVPYLFLLPTACLVSGCSRTNPDYVKLLPGTGLYLAWIDEQGELRKALPVGGAGFTHEYLHSINLSLVQEEFRAGEADRLDLVRLRYAQTSTGMPSGSEAGFRLEDGQFVLELSRSFEELQLRVSPVPGHGIRTDGGMYLFSECFAPGDLVVIRLIRKP